MIDYCDKEKAYIEKALKRIDNFLMYLLIAIISFVLGVWAGVSYETHIENIPIENAKIIDSLSIVNNKIKDNIEKLDSVKNAKIIEVSTLNNDSTLKLFKELVSE